MGAWNDHRSRQAGKFAKKTYQLEAARAAAEAQARQVQAAQAQAAHAAQLDHYWFTQGWNAAYDQPYVTAPAGVAHAAFQRGWYQAQERKQATGEAADARLSG